MVAMPGPNNDDAVSRFQQALLDVLEDHRHAELDQLDIEQTLATMVGDPYILFIGTLTGGDNRAGVRAFYEVLVRQLPPDLKWLPVARTIGQEQVVIETLLTFTHTLQMDWILPGIAPTSRYVEIPMAIVFTVRDAKVASERVYWDVASTLVQLGVLSGNGLPISGREGASKLMHLTGKS